MRSAPPASRTRRHALPLPASPCSPPAAPPARSKAECPETSPPGPPPPCAQSLPEGPPSAPMVITTPSTAATMPSPGSESATVLSAAIGALSPRCETSMSRSIIWSRSNGSMPPVTAIRSVSQTKSRVWWSLRNFGYLVNTALFSGSSISDSIASNPSFLALFRIS